jgi:hypothetical protein
MDASGLERNIYWDFDNFVIGSRRGRMRDPYVVDANDMDIENYGRVKDRGGRKSENSPLRRDDSRNSKLRPYGKTLQNNGGSFAAALTKLFKVLGKAEDLYSSFQGEYEKEVSSIRKYATYDVMDHLWKLRIGGKREKNDLRDADAQIDDETHGEKPSQKFEDMKTKIVHTMEAVLDSTIKEDRGSGRSKTCYEACDRLKEKVAIATNQIGKLLESVTRSPENCTALLNEIRLLKSLADPNADVNKNVFKASEDDESDSGNEGWHREQEQEQHEGRESWEG